MHPVVIFDFGAFAVLFALSALVRGLCFRPGLRSAAGAMGIVMAIGIFAVFSLPQLPFHSPWLARLITLEVLIIWLFLAGAYLLALFCGNFIRYLEHPMRRFGIGTWVAGSAVLAVLIEHAMPELWALAAALAVIAFAVYLPYVALFSHGYYRLLSRPTRQNARGVILLATVASQSVLIAFVSVFDIRIADLWFDVFFAIDTTFLCAGILLVVLHYHSFKIHRLAHKWKNTNCILHGAVSITGLGAVLASDLSLGVLMGIWRITLVLLIVVEAIEVIRAVQRVRRFGWREGVFVYNTPQWARNFTFGMFYAFSVSLVRHGATAPGNSGFGADLLALVVAWGAWLVLLVLLIEIGIFLNDRLQWPAVGLPQRGVPNWRTNESASGRGGAVDAQPLQPDRKPQPRQHHHKCQRPGGGGQPVAGKPPVGDGGNPGQGRQADQQRGRR